MKRAGLILALAMLTVPDLAAAQDNAISMGGEEVVVTAQRREANDYSGDIPAVGLRRPADFAVIELTISGDTRDKAQRESEIFAMMRDAIAAAPRSGVELAYGDTVLQPLTTSNYRDLTLKNDNRPDSQRVSFLAKVALKGDVSAKTAQERVTAFVKQVKPVGRALLAESDDMQLSIVAPDQYRSAVADAIMKDASGMAGKLGPGYAVELEGLNRPVEWARAGLSDVLIYVPYRLVIVPKP